MQVDRIGHLGLVDEAHHCFCAPLHVECRAGSDAIVSNKGRWPSVRVDLRLEFLDLYFEVLDIQSCYGIFYYPE
jgi:hypothetical protein